MTQCSICKEKWLGKSKAHCSGCHQTFKSVSAFDRHRRDFKCLNPEELGMERTEEGFFYEPMPEEYKNRLLGIKEMA